MVEKFVPQEAHDEPEAKEKDAKRTVFGSYYKRESFNRRLEAKSFVSQKVSRMFSDYGYPQEEIEKLVPLCIHEVSPILNKYAIAWHVLQNEVRRSELVEEETGTSVYDHTAIVFMDLDNLKSFNDIVYPQAGDWYLNKVSEIFMNGETAKFLETQNVRALPARFGGDEFIVTLSVDHGYGHLQNYKMGDEKVDLLHLAVHGGEVDGRFVPGYSAEIEHIEVPHEYNKLAQEKLLRLYDMAKQGGKELSFNREDLEQYDLKTHGSFGGVLMSELPDECFALFHEGEFDGKGLTDKEIGDEISDRFERIFVSSAVDIAAGLAKAHKAEFKARRDKESPVDSWVGARTAEQQDAEAKVEAREKVIGYIVPILLEKAGMKISGRRGRVYTLAAGPEETRKWQLETFRPDRYEYVSFDDDTQSQEN